MAKETQKSDGPATGEMRHKVSWDEIGEELDAKGSKQGFVNLKPGEGKVMTFLEDEPVQETFEGKDRNGNPKAVTSYHFRVECDGKEQILSVASSNLLRSLRSLRGAIKTLKGATVSITKEGTGFNTTYTVILISKP